MTKMFDRRFSKKKKRRKKRNAKWKIKNLKMEKNSVHKVECVSVQIRSRFSKTNMGLVILFLRRKRGRTPRTSSKNPARNPIANKKANNQKTKYFFLKKKHYKESKN